MTSQLSAQANQNTLPGTHNVSPAWTRGYCRVIWVFSAIASLLSARYILVEFNFHYPLLLYLAQISVTALVLLFYHPRLVDIQDGDTEVSASSSSRRGSLLAVCAMYISALSVILLLQAILRNDNLPTLAMLITIPFFIRSFLYLIAGYGCYSLAEAFRISLILLASIGILMAEYRLSEPGLKSSIPAMLCAGIASALRKAAAHHGAEMLGRREETCWLIGASYLIGAIGIIFFWSDKIYVLPELQNLSPCLLALLMINVATTTTALLFGRSIFFPMDEQLPGREFETDDTDYYDTFTLLFLTGVVGLGSVVLERRSYTSCVQYYCFGLAMVCASWKTLTSGCNQSSLWRGNYVSYELLDGTAMTPTDSEEGTDTSVVGTEVKNPFDKARHWLQELILLNICGTWVLLLVWVSLVGFNFTTPDRLRESASIDRFYEPSVPLEIVLNMYKEPIEDVRKLVEGLKSAPETSKASVTIYLKDQDADMEIIKQTTSVDEVIKLPNIGREGETYLRHINTHWDSLAKHTMYLPADVHFSREFYARLRNFFDPDRTGFLSLAWSDICNCAECGDQFFWHDTAGLFPKYYRELYNSTRCNSVLLSYKGSFIVSAARIRGVEKTIYKELWQGFVGENSWAHQPNYTQGRPDSMNAPDFGYTMERMWSLLFQCSNVDVAWKCPSLMSGWRLGGDMADCQCLDFNVSTRGQGATQVDPR